MAVTDFEALLKAAIGLDADSIGSSGIERAVQKRQAACALPDRQAYGAHVRACDAELQALIEAVVVGETWFFRDREAFAALARIGHDAWLGAPADRVFRVLSLPCSTGEEPYSVAMALFDAGVPGDRFRIDAVDVSPLALSHAKRGVYRKNSFRSHELAFRDRHFEATEAGHRVSDAVRAQVHLQQGNVFSPDFLPGADRYDVVFCRNLLIYFDRATQDRAVAVLERLLTSSGTLFVAPSETGLLLSHAFVPTKIPLAFAFRKSAASVRETNPAAARQVAHRSRRWPVAPPVHVDRATWAKRTDAAVVPLPPTDPRVVLPAGLDDAVRLANEGRFAEAATCCEAHLRQHGPSAETFHLMGLLRDASGDANDASSYYRKALYLDPTHHETLVHFAFLVEQQGDRAGAQVLRNRARRLEQSRTSHE
jgi:chemotaxis protein methyltransferase WspC